MALKKQSLAIVLCLLLAGLFCLFLITQGDLQLKKEYGLSRVFVNMWDHLTKLDFSIDSQMIGLEGFAINGITTAYFLPFPSLIRGILSLFNYGASASLSVLIGALTFMLASIGIWGQIFSASALPPTLKTISFLTGIVLCTLLSPIIGMMEYPTAFWEAIVWASALFLMACYFSMLLLNNKNNSFIFFGFTFFCGLTLFTRATFSMASCLLFAFTVIQMIVDTPRKKNKPHHFFLNIYNNKILLFNCFLFGSFVCCLLIFNYLKWGNPFEFYPMRYYKMWDEAQKNLFFSHGSLRLNRIPETFSYYFLPYIDNFSLSPPFIAFGNHNFFPKMGAFDYQEPTLPLSLTQPIFVLLWVFGAIVAVKLILARQIKRWKFLIPSASVALIPVFLILMIHSLSIRYAGDFLSACVIFGLFGFAQILILTVGWINRRNLLQRILTFRAGLFFLTLAILLTISALYLSVSAVFLQNQYWANAFYRFNLIPIGIGEKVTFHHYGHDSKAVGYLSWGWAPELESFGVWSNDTQSTLLILPPKNISNKNQIALNVRALVNSNYPLQNVEIWVNGQFNQVVQLRDPFSNWIYVNNLLSSSKNFTNISELTKRLYSQLTWYMQLSLAPIVIEFRYQNPARPKDLGIGEDDRLLSIGLISATLK